MSTITKIVGVVTLSLFIIIITMIIMNEIIIDIWGFIDSLIIFIMIVFATIMSFIMFLILVGMDADNYYLKSFTFETYHWYNDPEIQKKFK